MSQPKEDDILPEEITKEVSSIAHQESDFNQEQKASSSPVSSVEALYDRNRINNRTAPIQPVEPVVGLTPEEQDRREEDPDLTLDELLGLIPCEQHITTPLQTLDGLYVHQPSQFLPLAQEASQWLIYRAAQLYSSSTADCSTTLCHRASTSRYHQNT